MTVSGVPMMRLPACIAAALIFSAACADAQTRPDLSGRWTNAPQADAAAQGGRAGRGPAGRGAGGRGAADMGSGWGNEITIAQNATNLTVQYAFFGRGDMQPPLRFVFALDGRETTNTVMMGRGMQAERSRAGWQGDTLSITTVYPLPEPIPGGATTAEVKRLLMLDSTGALVVQTTRAAVAGGQSNTVRTVYRRVQ